MACENLCRDTPRRMRPYPGIIRRCSSYGGYTVIIHRKQIQIRIGRQILKIAPGPTLSAYQMAQSLRRVHTTAHYLNNIRHFGERNTQMGGHVAGTDQRDLPALSRRHKRFGTVYSRNFLCIIAHYTIYRYALFPTGAWQDQ